MQPNHDSSGGDALGTTMANVNAETQDVQPGMSREMVAVMAVLVASVLAVAVIGCSICLLLLRRRLAHKQVRNQSTEIVQIPSPFTTVQCLELPTDNSSYTGLELVAKPAQVDLLSVELRGEHVDARSLSHVKSCDDLPRTIDGAEFVTSRWENRSQSLASISFGIEMSQPYIRFNLEYVNAASALTVTITEVASLPLKLQERLIYTMIYLYPTNAEGIASKCTVYRDTAHFDESFRFKELSLDDLEKSTLKICAFTKKRKKSTKEDFIGQIFLKGSDVIWESNIQQAFNMKLEKRQWKRGSTSEKYLFRELGELFLLLQYQKQATRVKVLVRKANNLPKSDRLLGKPVHYVVIRLIKDGNSIEVRDTSLQSGSSPVWNQPFLFDTPGDIDAFSLEFVIMRGRRYKNGVVGHVTVGPETSSIGIGHWEETIQQHGREISQWHNIMPVFKFK